MDASDECFGACIYCRRPVLPDEETVKLTAHGTGEVRFAHTECRRLHQSREKAEQEWRNRSRREALISSWNYSVTNDLTTFPAWEFAREDNPEFMRRVSKEVATGISNWRMLGSLFVSAQTGSGKTALTVARLHREYKHLVAEQDADPGKDRSLSFAFISGPSLAGARRRGKIGDESQLVQLAVQTPLLVLDELGYEPISEELLFVIDERHKRARRIVTTTGRTLESFVERYGGSLFRKLTENGTTVEGWKK